MKKQLKKSSPRRGLLYKRVLLKLSGEVMEGKQSSGIDFDFVKELAGEIISVKKTGVELAIVIGGGNYWRYRDFKHSGLERVPSDYLGMLATIFNSVALASTLNQLGQKAVVLSAVSMPHLVQDYTRMEADKFLRSGFVVILSGGTGNPFFTTDSGAALRAAELNCNLIMKATNVDFVYDKDPDKFSNAKPFTKISYSEVLKRKLGVMDLTAIAMAMEAGIPISVFNLKKSGNIEKVLYGQKVGTKVIN